MYNFFSTLASIINQFFSVNWNMFCGQRHLITKLTSHFPLLLALQFMYMLCVNIHNSVSDVKIIEYK